MKAPAIALNLLVLAGLAHADMHSNTHMHAATKVPQQYGKTFERFATEMNSGMGKMTADMHAPGYSGDPDRDFLAMMIPHHEGAVTMARLVLQYGTDPATRKLAEDIIASQQVEIESMRRRLDDLRRGASRSHPGGYPALGGTRGGHASGSTSENPDR